MVQHKKSIQTKSCRSFKHRLSLLQPTSVLPRIFYCAASSPRLSSQEAAASVSSPVMRNARAHHRGTKPMPLSTSTAARRLYSSCVVDRRSDQLGGVVLSVLQCCSVFLFHDSSFSHFIFISLSFFLLISFFFAFLFNRFPSFFFHVFILYCCLHSFVAFSCTLSLFLSCFFRVCTLLHRCQFPSQPLTVLSRQTRISGSGKSASCAKRRASTAAV